MMIIDDDNNSIIDNGDHGIQLMMTMIAPIIVMTTVMEICQLITQ